LNKDRTLQLAADETGRALLALAARRTSFAVLSAAEDGPLTRAEAATANHSTAESADLVIRDLREAELLAPGPRKGRFVTYEITAIGQVALALIRRYGRELPPPKQAWWVTIKRRERADADAVLDALRQAGVSRVYPCVGDFDLVATLDDAAAAPQIVLDLLDRLRSAVARSVSAARVDAEP
jgi:hypothetical protein